MNRKSDTLSVAPPRHQMWWAVNISCVANCITSDKVTANTKTVTFIPRHSVLIRQPKNSKIHVRDSGGTPSKLVSTAAPGCAPVFCWMAMPDEVDGTRGGKRGLAAMPDDVDGALDGKRGVSAMWDDVEGSLDGKRGASATWDDVEGSLDGKRGVSPMCDDVDGILGGKCGVLEDVVWLSATEGADADVTRLTTLATRS